MANLKDDEYLKAIESYTPKQQDVLLNAYTMGVRDPSKVDANYLDATEKGTTSDYMETIQGYAEKNNKSSNNRSSNNGNYNNNLETSVRNSYEAQANSQISTINKNLDRILSDLTAGSTAINNNYNQGIANIKQNEFDTKATQTELMNSRGWNPTNSGLAIGEIGKIGIAADKNRDSAETSKADSLSEIDRLMALAKNDATVDIATLTSNMEKEIAAAIAQGQNSRADEEYKRYIDERDYNRDTYEDERDYNFDVNKYNYDVEKDDRDFEFKMFKDERDFGYKKEQDTFENRIKQSNLNLSQAKFAEAKRVKAVAEAKKVDENTLGVLYSEMMKTEEPSKWLAKEAPYMTDKELKALEALIPKGESETLEILRMYAGK